MPNTVFGFSGSEIRSLVLSWIGKNSSELNTFIERILPLVEFYYSKMHDWNYLRKRNLSLSVTSGQEEYALSVDTIGHTVLAQNIERIYSPAQGTYLTRTDLDVIRRGDPASEGGDAEKAVITKWAPGDDNHIVVWPRDFKDTELKVEAVIQPTALAANINNYPSVPYDKQWSFIKLVYAIVLERENDDKARSMLEEAKLLIREDIQAEERQLSDSPDDALKHHWEKRVNGALDRLLNDIDGLSMRR